MSLNSLSNQCCKTAFQAVRADHLECLAAMSKSDLSSRETSGQTPLHIAAKLNRLKIVDFLLKHVPETQNVISLYGENAILTAAAEGHFGVVRTLLSDGSLKTATMRAMHRDINGTSVLMLAVAYEDNDTAFWLLKRFGKALAMLPNKCLMLPLHVAAAQGNIEFIRVVTKYDSHMANFRDEFGCTACVYAIQCGSLLCLRYLVEKCRANLASVSDRGQSLLHVACLAGYPHIVQWILQRSVPNIIFWTTSHNANAIHFAAFSGCVGALRIMLKGIDKKRRKTVLALRDLRSNTPLHLTAINNHIEAAQYLV
uniref:ANK_REP_REGION domain-containing protein n=1 Tax=Syphacia muris TaxID=451379 RepID=A0A0N5AMI4_9BILA